VRIVGEVKKDKLVCPNCGNDKRYLVSGYGKHREITSTKGHASKAKYICLKCGAKYSASGNFVGGSRYGKNYHMRKSS